MENALSNLELLESESIHIMREVRAEFQNPVMLYSAGKDSSVLVRLAQKAFSPGQIPFPLLHVDTSYKFQEMIDFRDRVCRELRLTLLVHTNYEALAQGADPFKLGTSRCCGLLKTQALLDALKKNDFDAAIGGARRDEEKSRAKERIFSLRNSYGSWNPRIQRPEFWNLYNTRISRGQSMRVFPLSNWTELDIWNYIKRESIPVVPLYFARLRKVLVRGQCLLPIDNSTRVLPNEKPQIVMCRMRSLGCTHCSGAIRSTANTVDGIIQELQGLRRSERENRLIDHELEGAMEMKKREGYF
jgi:sulfate adenylyltransferase subunit 2